MTNSMLEQVARAVCANALGCIKRPRCINSEGTNAPCSASVDQLVLFEAWPTARAAIQAMRIPTEAMMSAVYGVWDRYGVRDVSEVDRDILRESLVAAIDSLLTEDTDK